MEHIRPYVVNYLKIKFKKNSLHLESFIRENFATLKLLLIETQFEIFMSKFHYD